MDATESANKVIEEHIRPALIRMFQMGEESARGRLISLLQGEIAPGPRAVTRVVRPNNPGYGALTKRVRDALAKVTANGSEGANAELVQAVCLDLTILQVRSALKTLSKTGDAVRVSRGNYLPASNSARAETGAVAAPAPVSLFGQSMEAVHSGPKGNGAL